MQARLLEIALLDPEFKNSGVVKVWEEVSDADNWSSTQSTMGNTTPIED